MTDEGSMFVLFVGIRPHIAQCYKQEEENTKLHGSENLKFQQRQQPFQQMDGEGGADSGPAA
jgi:hypothetical protein